MNDTLVPKSKPIVRVNQYGEHIISCPSCGEKGKKIKNQYWICISDDCRVWRFWTG